MTDNEQKFDVRFAPDAAKEYSKLKKSYSRIRKQGPR